MAGFPVMLGIISYDRWNRIPPIRMCRTAGAWPVFNRSIREPGAFQRAMSLVYVVVLKRRLHLSGIGIIDLLKLHFFTGGPGMVVE